MNSTENPSQLDELTEEEHEILQEVLAMVAHDDCPDKLRKEVLAIIAEKIPAKTKLDKLYTALAQSGVV